MSDNQKHNAASVYDIPEFSFKPGLSGHTLIMGSTRQGKTTTCDVLHSQVLASGGAVHVMDVGPSFEAFKRHLGK